MKHRKPELIRTDIKALGEELTALGELAEPTDDDVTRATTGIPEEFDRLEAELAASEKAAVDRERIISRAAEISNREDGDGARRPDTRRRGAPHIRRSTESIFAGLDLVRSGRFDDGDVIERAQYVIDRAPRHLSTEGREKAERLVTVDPGDRSRQAALIARHILCTGGDDYAEAFRAYMETGFPDEVLRATMTLAPASGGYLVPFTLDPSIVLSNAGIVDPLRRISTVKTIATDDWNGVTSAGVSTAWTAEGQEMTDGSPTFGQPTITPKRADAWVEGTYEMLADTGFASELGRLLADAKQIHEGQAFATGNVGATRPRGVVAKVASVAGCLVPAAANGALAQADVYAVSDALRPRDADKAVWLANKRIYNKIKQLDTSGGSAFWANMGVGRPSQLLGADNYEASSMTGTIAAGANVLLAGNFEMFYIVDRIGMSVQYDPMLKGANGRANGKAGWAAFWRVGADVVDPDAFRLLQLATAPAVAALG
ncbi:hypothetical protein GCM10010112_87080 [Actinoplanes lobatus]|uniref:HK97 family phage major capsid protein n=1 Tax=Actinoplanes lobatus TaxID=113568 RepID=A0A7W7HC15_9ACTN|nr:phage major capsid protein [Actinoplanes lobatus]MBB4747755.1 HK97 family phage major capsid protein [Actinoplanes lobatus]GGN96122.1 hypothetical protein GCM10010112_87080 [Actinoplanes lobatus]GIE45172.1 hypothetical protein Alo02nite_80700 [Actinoplanes lobatus]